MTEFVSHHSKESVWPMQEAALIFWLQLKIKRLAQRLIISHPLNQGRPGWRSQCSDSLRVEWSGFEAGGSEFFLTFSDRSRGSFNLLYSEYCVSLPVVKRSGRGVKHPPHLAPRLCMGRAELLPPLYTILAWCRVTFTFNI